MKAIFSRKYVPFTGNFDGTVAVIVPVVNEEEELFDNVLKRIIAQRPDEIVVIINGPRNEMLEEVCAKYPLIKCSWIKKASKREAVAEGARLSTSDILVLVDSDTVWDQNTLSELMKPFAESDIGGVTTHQSIFEPTRTFWTRLADYLEGVRTVWAMPAYSVKGQVGCLPGRTIAVRREVVDNHEKEFLNDIFMGVHLEISDDRTLTNYCLKDGYKTVYQSTSKVWTDAPLTFRKWLKQQYRWAKGSQYNTLRMIPWMAKNTRFLLINYLADVLIPLMIIGVWFDGILSAINQQPSAHGQFPLWISITAGLSGMLFGVAIRQIPRLKSVPSDILYIIPYVVVLTFIMPPIRIWALMKLAYTEGWGTRKDGYEGQKSVSLWRFVPIIGTLTALSTIMFLIATIFG